MTLFGDVVFALCAFTSLLCAILLWRGYRNSRQRLLMWSALCFTGLFLNNLMLLVDVRIVPELDLSVWRSLPALAGIACLLYGLIWESEG
jgi:hypothetical protein